MLVDSSRTVKLWLLCLYYIDVVSLLTGAEKRDDWGLYLIQSKKQVICLPLQGILIMLNVPGCICKTCLNRQTRTLWFMKSSRIDKKH